MESMIKVESGVSVYVNDVNPSGNHPVLFLHGWPLCYQAYEYQFNEFIKKGVRCIGMDTRGFGNSDKPGGGYGYDRLADDVRQVIEALKLENITLAGHSMGGAIAIRYMARHNGYGVSKLALFGAAAPSFTKSQNFPYGMTKEEVTKFIQQSLNDRPQMLRSFGDLFFFQYLSQPLSDWFYALGLHAAGWSTAECLVTLRDEVLFSDLSKINTPTLILHGTHDKICPYELGIAQNNGIKNSKLIPFEFSGHGAFYEQRDQFNQELLRFIGGM